jgi:hypothetical protein
MCTLAGCGEENGTAVPTSIATGAKVYTAALAQSATATCQSRSTRFPWGRTPARIWTPKATREQAYPLDAPGAAFGAPFSAQLVHAYGKDYGEARRTVILEMADGCRRQFRAESFVDADRAVIDAAVDQHPLTPDTADYAVTYRDDMTSQDLIDKGQLKLYTTQHFAIWYVTKTDGEFYRTIAQQGRSMDQVVSETAAWLEKQWLINREVINAPMPYSSGTNRPKLEVYFCGTGRPLWWTDDMEGCGANALETMNLSAWATGKGRHFITHEFGHMIQFYSSGFRDKNDAGPIWETGANFNAFTISPTFNPDSADYLNQLEDGFLFSISRYGASPFMTYLFEKDATRQLGIRCLAEQSAERRRRHPGKLSSDRRPAGEGSRHLSQRLRVLCR